MKTIALFTLSIMLCIAIDAQNFLIDFAGTGAATIVDSVKVENLSQCTSVNLSGTDVLNLVTTVNINEPQADLKSSVLLYPNPSFGNCDVRLESPCHLDVSIALYDMAGRAVVRKNEILEKGNCSFHITGIPEGIYNLRIESGEYHWSSRLVSNAAINSRPDITFMSATGRNGETASLRVKSIIGMLFHIGDTLKLTGKSGNYRTIMMLFPTQSQTVTFNFVDCTDADNNHYAVVQIGTQLWMAENLKTTKYRNGSDITNVPDSATWGSTTNGAYCNFLNLPAEGDYYGRLYNYYAVADPRDISPIGWHVSSNTEWNQLEVFLDPSVDTTFLGGTGHIIGRIMKEGCNTRWLYSDTTSGWNSAGFTALCTNFRNSSGAWSLAPGNNHDDSFWTSTSYSNSMAWDRSFRWCYADIYSLFGFKRSGSSVRCVKDN